LDVKRDGFARKKRVRMIVIAGAVLAGIAAICIGLSRLVPDAPSVNRETVWMDNVERGEMIRQVRGPGTLEVLPEAIRWVAARTRGRVERRLLLPGVKVEPSTIILELSNPELDQELRDAEFQLQAQEAEMAELRVTVESQLLSQKSTAAMVASDFTQAKLQAVADERLFAEELIGDLILKRSRVRAEELALRNDLEQQRLDIASASVEAQLTAKRATVEQFKALYKLRRSQKAVLTVRAGIHGVLQEVPVEVGQEVTPGQNLARVAQPDKLKAQLRIAQTQAKDIEVGQKAIVDTRNGIIEGKVIRIDPAVQEGTVTVDIALLEALPKGARPDFSVDGTIELERLHDVLYVGRPAYGQAGSTIGLFKLLEDGKTAVRAQVRLGRSSVNTIQIIQGLKEGDQVILSDTSAWDAYDRIRLY